MPWESLQIFSRKHLCFLEIDQSFLSQTFYLLQNLGAQKVMAVIHPAKKHVSKPGRYQLHQKGVKTHLTGQM